MKKKQQLAVAANLSLLNYFVEDSGSAIVELPNNSAIRSAVVSSLKKIGLGVEDGTNVLRLDKTAVQQLLDVGVRSSGLNAVVGRHSVARDDIAEIVYLS